VDLNAWLDDTRLVVCVGSGGVGKTTTAAAIGLWAAQRGRKAMVLTIDPAKRLANSLGLDSMGGEPTRIDLDPLGQGAVADGGELWAMMLDSRGTFDDLIQRVAPDEASRDRILANHVYRHMADAFAGSQDYMATEKLYDLVQDGRWDLLVLDTPPVKNALDFLESPGRLVRFLDDRVLKWFLAPLQQGSGSRIRAGTSQIVMKLLGYVLGQDFVSELTTFLGDFNGLYEGFRQRHSAVLEMMEAPGTSFMAVCAPHEQSIDIAEYFIDELGERGLPLAGVVVNQVYQPPHGVPASAIQGALPDAPAEQVERLSALWSEATDRLKLLSEEQGLMVQRVADALPEGAMFQQVPRLDGEVHDLRALRRVGDLLLAPSPTD